MGRWEDNGRVRKGGRNLGRSARTGGVKDERLAMAEGQNVKYQEGKKIGKRDDKGRVRKEGTV